MDSSGSNVDDLRDALRVELPDALLVALPEAVRRARLGTYLTDKEAQRETGLTRRQLRYLREKRRVEYRVVGKTILYPTDALFCLLDSGAVPLRSSTHK